jgi:hypothetical protein
MDRRLIILETRFDTILPTLATKTDVLELKAKLKQEIMDSFSELKGNISELKDTIGARNTRMAAFHNDIRAEMLGFKLPLLPSRPKPLYNRRLQYLTPGK